MCIMYCYSLIFINHKIHNYFAHHIPYSANFWQRKISVNSCLFAFFKLQAFVKIWMIKFSEPPVIHQIVKASLHQKVVLYGI